MGRLTKLNEDVINIISLNVTQLYPNFVNLLHGSLLIAGSLGRSVAIENGTLNLDSDNGSIKQCH